MKHIALVLALLMIVGSADAALTRIMKGVIMGDDLADYRYIQTNIEDEDLSYSYPSMWPGDNPNGTGTSLVVGPETVWGPGTEYYCVSLFGVADMFTKLPSASIASGDDIFSATFRVRHRWPSGGSVIGVHKVTNNWLYEGAELAVTALHRVPGGMNPWWAADLGKVEGVDTDWVGFSAADYDATPAGTITITDTSFGVAYDIDITSMVRDWANGEGMGNQGLALVHALSGQELEDWLISSGGNAPYFNASERTSSGIPGGGSSGPEFIITYAPEPTTIGLLAVGGLALIRRRRR